MQISLHVIRLNLSNLQIPFPDEMRSSKEQITFRLNRSL